MIQPVSDLCLFFFRLIGLKITTNSLENAQCCVLGWKWCNVFVTAVCFVNCHIISTQSCFISFIIGQISCLLFSRKDNVLLVKYISPQRLFYALKNVCAFVRGIYLNANDCICILRNMTDRRQHWLFYYLVSQYLDIDFSSLTHFPVPNDLVYLRL